MSYQLVTGRTPKVAGEITRPPAWIRPARVAVLLGVMIIAAALSACAAKGPAHAAHSGHFRSGAVAADHAAASEAGADMLRAGGNAVDAAVATSFALSVVRPYSCGIGGGGFMVIHLAHDGRQVALDYRETAPAATMPDMYANLPDGAGTRGTFAVAIPGTVAGLLYALEKYGTMDRARVLAPAIRLAENGFEVDAHYVESVRPLIRRFRDRPDEQERFRFVWKRFLRRGEVKVGDRIRLPEQGRALRLIARDGAAPFYEGPIAKAIVRALEDDRRYVGREIQSSVATPWITPEDLGAYWIKERAPLTFEFGGRRFITMPPPSSGGVVMARALGIVSVLRAPPSGIEPGWSRALPTASPAAAHRLVESLKHAFADRARWLGDPDFAPLPLDRLLSGMELAERATMVHAASTREPADYGMRAPAGEDGGDQRRQIPDDAGTSHLSVVDRWGNAVACTETINLTFGSLVAVEDYGFILNNEMDDFTTRRGEANAFGLRQSDLNLPAPRKRPLSSMTPTIVLNRYGRVEVIAGGAGGPRIITATLQVILHALNGADAGEAVAAPRLHHQWMPDRLLMEPALGSRHIMMDSRPSTFAESMAGLGHQGEVAGPLANVQAIVRDREGWGWTAASDPRKGGRPAGH